MDPNSQKTFFYIDYGARLTESRSTCIQMQELRKKAGISENDPGYLTRNYILNNGLQLARDSFNKMISDQRKKY